MRALVTSLVLLSAPALAAERIVCPPSISVTAQVTVKEAPGWRALPFPEHHPLASARLFDGDPSGMADLVPDKNTPAAISWTLYPEMSYTFVCTYNGTAVSYAAVVPKGAALCSVASKPFTSGRPPRGTYIEAACQ